MDIYLAGGISGNLFPIWKQIANGGGYECLPGRGTPGEERAICSRGGQLILESYYYCRKNDVIPKLLPRLGGFLLDSGAFTFMQGNGGRCDWDAYVEEYAEWINRYKIDLFFELDIDSIVGLKEVERLRAKLEDLTGKKSIPVWHKNRGTGYFVECAKSYPYVAIGGIVGGNKNAAERKAYRLSFPWFINTAHKYGAKIHGLGYTSIEGLKQFHFDSVDSTAWLYGNRGGYLYKFNPRKGDFDKIVTPPGHRLKSRDAALYNFREWIKFQEYAKKYL